MPLRSSRLARPIARKDEDSQPEPRQLDLSFSQTMSCLNSFGGQPDSASAIQVATVRFQRAVLELRQAEAAVAAMRNDRLLLAFKSLNHPPSAPLPMWSGDVLDAASFGALADHVIEEQATHVLDLHEVVRSEVAALDGQLKRLTVAFEEDVRRQFYKPVLGDLRRNSSAWKVQMGQVQTTTIRTHDRMPARVSPGQTAVLDRPVRRVLLQEGLQVAHGLAQEAQSLAQYGSLQAAGNAVAPGSSALLAQTGLAPVPGQHLGQLVEPSERITVSVGDDISVTPVIQPDGCTVAFHLVYAHHSEPRFRWKDTRLGRRAAAPCGSQRAYCQPGVAGSQQVSRGPGCEGARERHSAAGGHSRGGGAVSATSFGGLDGAREHHSGGRGHLSDRDGPRGEELAGTGAA